MFFTRATALAIIAAVAEAGKGKNTFAVLRFRDSSLTSGRMDPIVNPGVPSGHVHVIQGGNAFSLTMDENTPYKSTCTSAQVNKDFSNYWTPTMYFKDPKTGMLESVNIFYQNVYYFFDAEKEEVQPFPKGLRMFVGNPGARTPPKVANSFLDNDKGTIQPIQWTCPRKDQSSPLYPPGSNGLQGVGIQDPGNGGQGVGFPDKNCDGYASPLRADIHFPSCYDPSKGPTNYKENMQWPTNGACPKGFIHVPHLFYEVYWDTLKFQGRWTPGQGKSPWVLSNGDPTGYGLHADFINGWETETLQAIINTCDAGFNGMDKCPSVPGGTTLDGSCHIDNLVPETIFGTMAKLPGGNAIGEWGVAGSGGGGGGGSAAPAPSTKSTVSAATSKATAGNGSGNTQTKASTKAAAATSKAATGPKASTKGTVKASTKAPSPTTPPKSGYGSAPGAGGSNTLVTSYVSETTTIYTTITLPVPAATGKAVANGWNYKGCYLDLTPKRVLTGITFADIGQRQVTNTKCAAYCESKGFSIAGTEFGGQCFCGNEMVGTKKIDESKCAMKCEGDGAETCGGPAALSVYSTAKKSPKMVRRAPHVHHHLQKYSH